MANFRYLAIRIRILTHGMRPISGEDETTVTISGSSVNYSDADWNWLEAVGKIPMVKAIALT